MCVWERCEKIGYLFFLFFSFVWLDYLHLINSLIYLCVCVCVCLGRNIISFYILIAQFFCVTDEIFIIWSNQISKDDDQWLVNVFYSENEYHYQHQFISAILGWPYTHVCVCVDKSQVFILSEFWIIDIVFVILLNLNVT